MYWDFEVSPGCFRLPGFPEPLLSANFSYREGEHYNVVGTLPHENFEIMNQFHLCLQRPSRDMTSARLRSEPLMDAIKRTRFWSFTEEHHPQGGDFLRRLFPFLCEVSSSHTHFFYEGPSGIVASAIQGSAGRTHLLLNALVDSRLRNTGLLTSLNRDIRTKQDEGEYFYWTKHPWLKTDVTSKDIYQIVRAS